MVDHIAKTNDSNTNDLTDEPFHYTEERFWIIYKFEIFYIWINIINHTF